MEIGLAGLAPTKPAPALAMLRLLGGFQISQALYVAARARIADQLLEGPRPLHELAESSGLWPEPLARIIQALAVEEVFDYDAETEEVRLGRLGRTLASGVSDSVRNVALTWMETHYQPFGHLWQTAETGRPAADLALGMPFFDWLGQKPDRVETFTAAMTDFVKAIRQDAVNAVELDGAHTLVDIGGADGTVLVTLASRYPELHGVVFDLPHVVEAAPELLRAHQVDDRITTAGGDFFTEVPPGDCYLLSFVLHDWSDEKAGHILDRIHQAASVPDARLVLVETVLDRGDAPQIARLLDLTMLGMLTGRERSSAAWRELLAANGFRLDRIRPTAGPMCVIEATRTG
ncbi:methyltransferase [Streptomyces lunalinharesii]|uniref:Methyltransferase n=1 Tax=Streptomyces lunalinharesii TaxID=333384 RepID=A0ABN3T0J4_9ACTN